MFYEIKDKKTGRILLLVSLIGILVMFNMNAYVLYDNHFKYKSFGDITYSSDLAFVEPTEEICRCTSENPKYVALKFCVSKFNQNDTEWEEMKEAFFEDEFIKDYLKYECSPYNDKEKK